jgi:hypothetical protein
MLVDRDPEVPARRFSVNSPQYGCPDVPPSPAPPSTNPTPRLDHFIVYALHRTRLHSSVTFAALYLLQRLKARFPAAKGSSGHRLFISAFMLASKIICDDTYCIVGQVCSLFGRSIRWSGRCAPNWSGSLTSILRHYGIFNLVSSLISLDQAHIHRRYCLSQHPLHSPIKAREIISTQVWVPLFLRSLLTFHCSKMRPLFPVRQSEHTPHLPPIPQRPPTRPRPLPRHRYRRRRRPMLTGQDSSSLYRQIRVQSRHLSSHTATDQLC